MPSAAVTGEGGESGEEEAGEPLLLLERRMRLRMGYAEGVDGDTGAEAEREALVRLAVDAALLPLSLLSEAD